MRRRSPTSTRPTRASTCWTRCSASTMRRRPSTGCRPPLIIVGSAGSGKTALTLEKMKAAAGDILYVTRSPFLARHARDLYYAHGYESRAPERRLPRLPRAARIDPGAGGPGGGIPRLPRLAAAPAEGAGGARASAVRRVQGGADRARRGPSVARPRGLPGAGRAPLHLPRRGARLGLRSVRTLARMARRPRGSTTATSSPTRYLSEARPRYDFAVVDEVQDLTNVQLALILRLLRRAGQFLLCGDSNQIVHPNFFSWAQLKTLFFDAGAADPASTIHVLRANYRNGGAVVDLANRLLRVKQLRFGSVDRESNYLVDTASAAPGAVELLPRDVKLLAELDRKTRQSTRFAVLVLREESKAAAREHFHTPLVFSVQEAKGLEYETVILFDFVSSERRSFAEIAGDLAAAGRRFRRADLLARGGQGRQVPGPVQVLRQRAVRGGDARGQQRLRDRIGHLAPAARAARARQRARAARSRRAQVLDRGVAVRSAPARAARQAGAGRGSAPQPAAAADGAMDGARRARARRAGRACARRPQPVEQATPAVVRVCGIQRRACMAGTVGRGPLRTRPRHAHLDGRRGKPPSPGSAPTWSSATAPLTRAATRRR